MSLIPLSVKHPAEAFYVHNIIKKKDKTDE